MKKLLLVAALVAALISHASAQPVPPPVSFQYGPTVAVPTTIPTALGWDQTHFPLTLRLYDVPGLGRSYATASFTPESIFDAFSTARSAPTTTYYVAPGGSDGNNCTSLVTACAGGAHAVTLGNATTHPYKIIVSGANSYVRANTIGFGAVSPTQDVAFVANGGRVVMGSFDAYSAPSRDGTNTNTYTFAVSNVDRVFDLLNLDQYGNYVELLNVATAAIANIIPNSWAIVGNANIYINRADQVAVTNANTRVMRSGQAQIYARNQVNIYVGGASGNDGFDFEGGSATGVLDALLSAPTSTNKVLAVSNSTFKYGGGIVGTATRGVSVDSWQGLAFFQNVRADANATDGINRHNTNAATNPLFLTLNSTAFNNGRGTATSNNGWTTHEDVIGISAGDFYWNNRGGSYRSINTSKSLIAGGFVSNDFGDIANGGTIKPTAFSIGNTGTYWVDRTKCGMPAGTYCYVTELGTATINMRNVWPVGQPNSGPGTFANY